MTKEASLTEQLLERGLEPQRAHFPRSSIKTSTAAVVIEWHKMLSFVLDVLKPIDVSYFITFSQLSQIFSLLTFSNWKLCSQKFLCVCVRVCVIPSIKFCQLYCLKILWIFPLLTKFLPTIQFKGTASHMWIILITPHWYSYICSNSIEAEYGFHMQISSSIFFA